MFLQWVSQNLFPKHKHFQNLHVGFSICLGQLIEHMEMHLGRTHIILRIISHENMDLTGQKTEKKKKKNLINGNLPGGPVVKMSPFNAGGEGSTPGQGVKIPRALWAKHQNKKQKQYCHKFDKDFKNGQHKKKKSLKIKTSSLDGRTKSNTFKLRGRSLQTCSPTSVYVEGHIIDCRVFFQPTDIYKASLTGHGLCWSPGRKQGRQSSCSLGSYFLVALVYHDGRGKK